MEFPKDPIAFIDNVVDEMKLRLRTRTKAGETLRYMGETLDQQGRGEDFFRIFVCNPKPRDANPESKTTDLALLELYEHWRAKYRMRPIEAWDGTRLRPWLPPENNPQVPEVLKGDLSTFSEAITRAPGDVIPWRRLDALGHTIESYFTAIRRHSTWSRALQLRKRTSVPTLQSNSHSHSLVEPAQLWESGLHAEHSPTPAGAPKDECKACEPSTAIVETGSLRLYFHNELNNIETAPYSVRFWGFLKWADQLRRKLLDLPTIHYHHDGESDISFMDRFILNHFPWHDDVFGLGACPTWDDQLGRWQTHRYPMGSQGYGVEFYQFHRDLIDAYDAWLKRNGRAPISAWHPGKHHTSYVLKYAWDWLWGRGGTNGRPLDPDIVAPELRDPKLRAFETLAELGNYLDVCGVAYHGIGHVQNCDIRDPYCNNYSIRFFGWHRWLDDLFRKLEEAGKPVYDQGKPMSHRLDCSKFQPPPSPKRFIEGRWTYRSYQNDADPTHDPAWFVAEMELYQNDDGTLSGELRADDPRYRYALDGYLDERNVYYETTPDWWDERLIIVLKAVGVTPETAGHQYEYRGYLEATWPNGKDQIPAFVGTMIRAVRPDNPSLEGTVGSFIAVRRADAGPAPQMMHEDHQQFDESGVFLVPDGVAEVFVQVWGGGGGGGSDGPGVGEDNGDSGGESGFGYLCSASGGDGGQHGVYQLGKGGAGGTGHLGTKVEVGEDGETGGTIEDQTGKGGAGAAGGGAGGGRVGPKSNGKEGAVPGGGGSGAMEGNTPAGGGGGGGYAEGTFGVTPGTSIPIYVGQGGNGGDGGYRVGGSGARGRVVVSWAHTTKAD